MITQEMFEEAAVAFLVPLLAADTTLAGLVYEVRPGRSQEDDPGDRSVVVVLCGEVINFRESLKEAQLSCFVRSPADVDGVTLETHGALTLAPETAWGSANAAAWGTALAAVATGWTGGGFYREGWNGGREDTAWLPALGVKVGAVSS